MTPALSAVALPSLAIAPSPRRAEPASGDGVAFADELERSAPTNAPSVVRTTRTRLSGGEAAGALSRAWTEVFGEVPNDRTVAVLTAQWAHETGRGAQMMNYNFGGIKGVGPSGLSAAYATREGWGATERRTVDHFRAYRTAAEGATDYVRLLARRYPAAVRAARAGDAQQFVRALKESRYFTGDENAYVRSVQTLTAQGLSSGFDALGGARGAAPDRLDLQAVSAAARDERLPAEALGADTSASALDTAQAVADELGRAALRALVSDAGGDDLSTRDG